MSGPGNNNKKTRVAASRTATATTRATLTTAIRFACRRMATATTAAGLTTSAVSGITGAGNVIAPGASGDGEGTITQ